LVVNQEEEAGILNFVSLDNNDSSRILNGIERKEEKNISAKIPENEFIKDAEKNSDEEKNKHSFQYIRDILK